VHVVSRTHGLLVIGEREVFKHTRSCTFFSSSTRKVLHMQQVKTPKLRKAAHHRENTSQKAPVLLSFAKISYFTYNNTVHSVASW
jgi:hypothetical protein